MCGRYAYFDTATLAARFEVPKLLDGVADRYNVSPGAVMPVIARQSPKRAVLMKWGLIPAWAKDPKIGYRMINARAETLMEKPAYRRPFLTQRCLVPANGFFEWQRENQTKIPFYFAAEDEKVLAMAGIFERFKNEKNEEILSYSIITTKANEVVSPVHERMPVLLSHEDEDRWLEPEASTEMLVKLTIEPTKVKLERRQVSTLVNNPRNDSPEILEA